MNYNKHKNNCKIKGGMYELSESNRLVLDEYIPLLTDYKIKDDGISEKIPDNEKKSIHEKIDLYFTFFYEYNNYKYEDLYNVIYKIYAGGLRENNEIYYEFRRVEYLHNYYKTREKKQIEVIYKLMKAIDDSVNIFTHNYRNKENMPLLSSIHLVKIDSDVISDFISELDDFENEISLLLHILNIRKHDDETPDFFKFKKNLYRLFFLKEIIKAKENLDKFKTTGEKSKFKTASKMKCYSYDRIKDLPSQKIS